MNRRLFIVTLRDGLVLLQCAGLAVLRPLSSFAGEPRMDGSQTLKLFLAGDVMTGRGIDQVLAFPSEPLLYETYVEDARRYVELAERKNGPIPKPVDYHYIWGDALDGWRVAAPDLRIVNLETSVTTNDVAWSGKGIHYRMHPSNVACLSAAQLDCCVLANNHVLDWGYAGLDETLTNLRDAGIATAGAGQNIDEAMRPARLQISGMPDVLVFGIADASSGVPASWRAQQERGGVYLLEELSPAGADKIGDHIASYRQPGDVVVVSVHWGSNWGYDVPSQQRRFAHRLIDNGAVDVIHGHSSHHARPLEIYRDKLILYGCGDLITDYEGIGGHERFRPWHAPLYFVSIDTNSRRVTRLEIELLQMRRFRLTKTDDDDRNWFATMLNEAGRDFGTAIDVNGDYLVARCGEC